MGVDKDGFPSDAIDLCLSYFTRLLGGERKSESGQGNYGRCAMRDKQVEAFLEVQLDSI